MREILTVPPVVHEPTLLGRLARGRAVDSDVVLREHDAPLQLGGVGVRRERQVDEAALAPVIVPPGRVSLANLRGEVRGAPVRREVRRKLQRSRGRVAGRRERVPVGGDLVRPFGLIPRECERGVGRPAQVDEVARLLHLVSDVREVGAPAARDDVRRVVQREVVHAGEDLVLVLRGVDRRVGEVELDLEVTRPEQRGLDAERDGVRVEVALGHDRHGLAANLERRGDGAGPERELLPGIRDVGGREGCVLVLEADAAQVDAVRVADEPLRDRGEVGVRDVVRDVPAVREPRDAGVVAQLLSGGLWSVARCKRGRCQRQRGLTRSLGGSHCAMPSLTEC